MPITYYIGSDSTSLRKGVPDLGFQYGLKMPPPRFFVKCLSDTATNLRRSVNIPQALDDCLTNGHTRLLSLSRLHRPLN